MSSTYRCLAAACLTAVVACGAEVGLAGVLYLADPGTGSNSGTLYQYDTQSNILTTIATGLDQPSDLAYDPVDNVAYIAGHETVYRYDFAGNTLSHQAVPELDSPTRLTYTYDANQPQIIVENSSGTPTVYQYDYDSNVIRTLEVDPPSPPNPPAPGNLSRYTYDAGDNKVYMAPATGATSIYQYDANGHTLNSTSISGLDANGDVSDISSAGGGSLYISSGDSIYRYDYGGSAAATVVATPEAGTEISRFTYDANFDRLLIATPGPAGSVTLYQYDSSGNRLSVQAISAPGGGTLSPSGFALQTTVPEPTTLLIFGGCAALIFGRSLRRGLKRGE